MHHNPPRLRLAAILWAVTSASVCVHAAAPNPCTADIDRFCAGVAPGDGRLARCLGETHVDQISENCRKHLKRTLLRTQLFDVEDDCLDAAQRLCFDAVLLGGEFEDCMDERRDALPGACRGDIEP
jgi:hypothetical protein